MIISHIFSFSKSYCLRLFLENYSNRNNRWHLSVGLFTQTTDVQSDFGRHRTKICLLTTVWLFRSHSEIALKNVQLTMTMDSLTSFLDFFNFFSSSVMSTSACLLPFFLKIIATSGSGMCGWFFRLAMPRKLSNWVMLTGFPQSKMCFLFSFFVVDGLPLLSISATFFVLQNKKFSFFFPPFSSSLC